MNDGKIRIRVYAGEDDVHIFAERGIDGDHGSGRLLVALELALLGIEQHELLVVFEDFDNHALCGVVLLGFGVGTLQNQRVRAKLHGFAEIHRALHVCVEGGAGEADEDENHAKVNNVAAVTPRVAHGEFLGAHDHTHAGARRDDLSAAVELHDDGAKNEAAENKANDGADVAVVKEVCGGAREQSENDRPAEIALEAVTGSLAPGEERANASQEKKRKPHRDHNLVEERRTDADAVAGEPFGKDRKKRAGQNGNAGDEEEQVVKEEAGFAGDHRIELIFALQIIAILDVGNETDQER